MRYELRVTAFDMLDQIHVSTALFSTTDSPELSRAPVLALCSQVPGTGTTDPREWARDALLAALEDL